MCLCVYVWYMDGARTFSRPDLLSSSNSHYPRAHCYLQNTECRVESTKRRGERVRTDSKSKVVKSWSSLWRFYSLFTCNNVQYWNGMDGEWTGPLNLQLVMFFFFISHRIRNMEYGTHNMQNICRKYIHNVNHLLFYSAFIILIFGC